MPESPPVPGRVLQPYSVAMPLILLGLTQGPGVGSARASGCHAPDRPVLGLSLAWEGVFDPASRKADPTSLRRAPCSSERPGLPQTVNPPSIPVLALPASDPDSSCVPRHPVLTPSSPLHPINVMAVRERPPRSDRP
jgi:hypothetical protein